MRGLAVVRRGIEFAWGAALALRGELGFTVIAGVVHNMGCEQQCSVRIAVVSVSVYTVWGARSVAQYSVVHYRIVQGEKWYPSVGFWSIVVTV